MWELNEWLGKSENNRTLFERFSDEDYVAERLELMQRMESGRDAQWNKLLNIISNDPDSMPVTMPSRMHIGWQRYVAAAAVVVVIATSAWMWMKYGTARSANSPIAAVNSASPKDIAPGTNKAILTLSDGSTIVLDSAGKGVIAQQGNTRIEKIGNGQLAYNKLADNELNDRSGQTIFNTLTTPPAAQFQVVLPDGSRVWLNNASSLRYPTSFAGNTREVELTGEAYFEIAKDAARPFEVRVNDMKIDVLGTSFNVMAYANESAVKTTLLSGGVKVFWGDKHSILKPGQQALVNASGLKLTDEVNIDAVIAWKNGFFNFDNADIPAVMRQIGRWYDVEVNYEGTMPVRSFGGKMNRNLHLSEVVEILKTSDINCRIEGRKLIVTR
ncbi:MAG TPA: FecR domain-containing protein [Puia sp.]|nr:FecR domain-containing protein [Puia sp.]